MLPELRDVFLADFTSRVARLELRSPGIGERPIPALDGLTISDAMQVDELRELVDITLNRLEESVQHEIAGFGAFLVEGLGTDRFVWFRHAVLGRRTSGPMAVGAQVKLIDSHSGLLLSDEYGMPEVWTVEPAPGQLAAHGGFAAKPGELLRLHLYSGGRVLSLDDLINPVGSKIGSVNAARLASISASMRNNGTANRRRVEFVGQPAEHRQASKIPAEKPPADTGNPALECDLHQAVGASSGLKVASRWESSSFFVDVGLPGTGSPLLSVEFYRPSVVLESVFPTPPSLANDLQLVDAAMAIGDGELFSLGTTELQQQVLEARLRWASGKPLPPQMLIMKHFAVHFADSQRAFQVIANSVQVHRHFEHNGDSNGQ